MSRIFRAHPSSLHRVRTFIRDLAEQRGLDGTVTEEVVLAVSEAAANAVLHTNSPTIDVAWRASPALVEVEVHDSGVFDRRIPLPEVHGRGRGIPMMMALMDEVTIREGTPGRPGTMVRLAKRLQP